MNPSLPPLPAEKKCRFVSKLLFSFTKVAHFITNRKMRDEPISSPTFSAEKKCRFVSKLLFSFTKVATLLLTGN